MKKNNNSNKFKRKVWIDRATLGVLIALGVLVIFLNIKSYISREDREILRYAFKFTSALDHTHFLKVREYRSGVDFRIVRVRDAYKCVYYNNGVTRDLDDYDGVVQDNVINFEIVGVYSLGRKEREEEKK